MAWFITGYFTHSIDSISQARNKFRPQNTINETVLAEQSDYVWDLEWSHPLFLNIPIDISSQANSTIFIYKEYIKVYSITIDATPLNSPYKITLPLGLLGYCETNALTSPTKDVAYKVNNTLQLLDICQLIFLTKIYQ